MTSPATEAKQLPSKGQLLALRQLDQIAVASQGSLMVQSVGEPGDAGSVLVEISVDCSQAEHRVGGIRLRNRERIYLLVPRNFPLEIPSVLVPHRRFAGHPHVQWGFSLCLYQSPATEWSPSDGMFGLIDRLVKWLRHGSRGELDPIGQPLHPPVAYTSTSAGCVVVRADAPQATASVPWLGVAVMRWRADDRVDLIGWRELAEVWPSDYAGTADGIDPRSGATFVALAVVLTRPIGFEFPKKAADLVEALAAEGVNREHLLGLLGRAAGHNKTVAANWPRGTAGDAEEVHSLPTLVIVGTPSRGVAGGESRLTHIVAWRLTSLGTKITDLVSLKDSPDEPLAEIGRRVLDIGKDWLSFEQLQWARVYEQRPEITIRRDTGSPPQWLTRKRVVLLGAGAIGGPIAEICVRAGVQSLVLVDNGRVQPGLLVRQPYDDADIHRYKADALRDRLLRANPETEIDSQVTNIVALEPELVSQIREADLVIDATANRMVSAAIEQARTLESPALLTVMIGHDAQRGVVTLAKAQASGGGYDILRRVGIAAHATPALKDVAADFFPASPRTTFFQPEPGCSEATFVGSYAETNALAAQLMLAGLRLLADENVHPMSAAIIRLSDGAPTTTGTRLSWLNDVILTDANSGIEIRIAAEAMAEMRAEARRGRRVRRPAVETGGTLLGQIDDAVGVAWVSAATGPPPDSQLSRLHFEHGVAGVERTVEHWDRRSAGAIRFIGMWHSHPFGIALPSPTDKRGMAQLVLPVKRAPYRALMVIVGGAAHTWQGWLDHGAYPDIFAELVERSPITTTDAAPQQDHTHPLQEWWEGGFRGKRPGPIAIRVNTTSVVSNSDDRISR